MVNLAPVKSVTKTSSQNQYESTMFWPKLLSRKTKHPTMTTRPEWSEQVTSQHTWWQVMMMAAQTNAPAMPWAEAERSQAGLVGRARPAETVVARLAIVVNSGAPLSASWVVAVAPATGSAVSLMAAMSDCAARIRSKQNSSQ